MKKFIICKTNFRKLSAKKMADRLALFFSANKRRASSKLHCYPSADGWAAASQSQVNLKTMTLYAQQII